MTDCRCYHTRFDPLTDPDSPVVREALTRACECGAPKDRHCTSITATPLNRLVHHTRTQPRKGKP